MKKIIKISIWLVFLCISFFITEKIGHMAMNKNPIMQTINENYDNYKTASVNATIINDEIIPGIAGKEINKKISFNKMKKSGVYNANDLVFNYVFPQISILNNKDKIIISGNKQRNSISLIINHSHIDYFVKNKIKINVLTNIDLFNYLIDVEYINNDYENYEELETLFNKYNINKDICIINKIDKDHCLKKDKYLVKYSYVINNSNIVANLSKISKGDIIYIESNTSIENINIIISSIKFKNINIVYLSELISESI